MIYETISPGIEKRVVLSQESGEKSPKLFKNICSSGKSICLITNIKNALALLPFADILIMDECGSRFYTNNKRPHIPYGELLMRIASVSKLKTILAGSYLNISQYLLAKNKVLLPNNESNTRFLIDNQKISFSLRSKDNWELFTEEAKKILEKSDAEKTFIFSPKPGLFPTTICNDCKSPLTCDICHAPMRLVEKGGKEREFVCPRCAHKINADVNCPKCDSWNLKPFGIGSERLVESIKTNYPDINIFYLPENSSLTEIKKTLNSWAQNNGVLIGGERIMNKLIIYPENIIFASIDSLFGVPNYRISERVIELILNANDFATKKLHIITGLKDEYLFNEIKRGNLKMFYEDELADRQTLNFPPFGYLLNIKKSLKPGGTVYNNADSLSSVKKLLRELDKSIEISMYTKNQGQNIIIATGLYTPETWHTKIASNIAKLTDQSFDIYVNETDWLN